MKIIAVVLAFAVCGTLAAPAQESGRAMTVGELAQLCKGSDTTSKNVCRVYILGVTQGIEVGIAIADGKAPGGRPCIADDISAEALQSVVKQKLDSNLKPKDQDGDASGFIGRILGATFACSKSKR